MQAEESDPDSPVGRWYAAGKPTPPRPEHSPAARSGGEQVKREAAGRSTPKTASHVSSRGARRKQRRGPRALEALSSPQMQIACLECEEPGAAIGASEECITKRVMADVRIEIVLDRQHSHVASYDGTPQLMEARRTARYHMYRAIACHQFAGEPQGAGQRIKLADCMEREVRRLFPNPLCTSACDFLRGCEHAGHYTGFLSASESRQRRMRLARDGWKPLWKDEDVL